MSGESSSAAPLEVPRPVVSEGEISPQRPAAAATGRESVQPSSTNMIGPVAFQDEQDDPMRRSLRWGPPPPPNADEWRAYWDRKRHEREWYPDYIGPERDSYDGPGPGPRGSGVYRSGSRRGPAVVYRLPRSSYNGPERGSFERDRERGGPPRGPAKDEIEEYFDSEDEMAAYYGRGYRGGGGRGPPHDVPTVASEPMRLPWIGWLNTTAKGHFVATLGEFIGTTMFLLFAFAGTQVANIGSRSADNTTTNANNGFSPEVLLYIALSFGFSLMVNVWIFFRISGGLFNPAVTLGMVLTKSISVPRALLLTSAQITGSIFASFLVDVLFPTQFNVRTTLSSGTSLARGVFIEAILTAELVFTIFMLAKEKHKATFIAPVGIGLALFISELVGVYYTGGSLNPARSLGPCVVTGTFDHEHWIYWVGPAAGSMAAVLFYKFIKILEYEMANPGQDEQDPESAGKRAREVREEQRAKIAARVSAA